MFTLVPYEVQDDNDSIFYILLVDDEENIAGYIGVFRHPEDAHGAEVHLEIVEKWQKRWLTKGLKSRILNLLIECSKICNIETLYSVALTPISPRLLEFFEFQEYFNIIPKRFYYMEVN